MPLYWGRSSGGWPLMWRWGSDVLSRGRNLWAAAVLVWGSCSQEINNNTQGVVFCFFSDSHSNRTKLKKQPQLQWILTAWPVTSKERERLFFRRASKSASRGVWFLVVTCLFRGRVHVACIPGPSPVLLDRLSSDVACLSSGLGCRPHRIGKPRGGASLKDRLLFCFLGSRGEGGGGNRKASTSRALERRQAAFTTMFWTPFRICCLSAQAKGQFSYAIYFIIAPLFSFSWPAALFHAGFQLITR